MKLTRTEMVHRNKLVLEVLEETRKVKVYTNTTGEDPFFDLVAVEKDGDEIRVPLVVFWGLLGKKAWKGMSRMDLYRQLEKEDIGFSVENLEFPVPEYEMYGMLSE